VLENPGAAGGQVVATASLPLPCGAAIAPQYSSSSYIRAAFGGGKVRRKGKNAKVLVDSAPRTNPCRVRVDLLGRGKGKSGKHKKGKRKQGHAAKKKTIVLGRSIVTIPGGQSQTVKVKLSKRGRVALSRARSVRVRITTLDPAGDTAQIVKAKVAGKKHKKHHKHKKHK
jgi:hypothetical protein